LPYISSVAECWIPGRSSPIGDLTCLFAEPGRLGLAPGGNNTLVRLDQDGLDPIVVISWSPQSAGLTTYGAFGPTMETLEVGEPEQSPLGDG
jgi:hypothetical protein